jgi:hypothetical protein
MSAYFPETTCWETVCIETCSWVTRPPERTYLSRSLQPTSRLGILLPSPATFWLMDLKPEARSCHRVVELSPLPSAVPVRKVRGAIEFAERVYRPCGPCRLLLFSCSAFCLPCAKLVVHATQEYLDRWSTSSSCSTCANFEIFCSVIFMISTCGWGWLSNSNTQCIYKMRHILKEISM